MYPGRNFPPRRQNRFIHVLSAILPARWKVSAWIHWLYVCWEIRKTHERLGAPENSLVENRNERKRRKSQSFVSPSVHQNEVCLLSWCGDDHPTSFLAGRGCHCGGCGRARSAFGERRNPDLG